jgi:hypothetical protein
MKKYLILLLLSIHFFSAHAQFLSKQSAMIRDKDLAWDNISNHESVKPPKNPEIEKTQEIIGTATCFCKVSFNNLTGQTGSSGVCLDLTSAVGKTYSGVFPMKDENRKDCQTRCSDVAASLSATQKQAIADCACSNGVGSGTAIRAYGAVGTKEYQSDQTLGTLVNNPEVKNTTCKCPIGWLSNTTNIDGGVTTDGNCKKIVCQPIGVAPPPNGTPVGTWGFIWGNALYAIGSNVNGGAANCVTVLVSPKVCKLQ